MTNYNDLINAADAVTEALGETKETLTDEQVDIIAETLSETAKEQPSFKELQQAKEDAANNTDELVSEVHNMSIDPTTGNITSIFDNDDFENLTLEDIYNDDSISVESINPENVTINNAGIDTVIGDIYGDDNPLTLEDYNKITYAVDIYKTGKTGSWYNMLPKVIQDKNDAQVGAAPEYSGSFIKQAKKYAAEQFLEFILRECTMDNQIVDLQHSIQTSMTEAKGELSESYNELRKSQKQYYEVRMLDMANQLEEHGETNKAEMLRECSTNYIESYSLTSLIEAYKSKKVKLKKIQVEKFDRCCREFNSKYTNTKLAISDISMLLPVLDRHLDKKYDLNIIKAFIVIFINYTMNMKPDNIAEHTFMYYFVNNILSFDYIVEADEVDVDLHKNLKETIENMLKVISENETFNV